MSRKSPRTPPASRRLAYDPDTTPTRHRPRPERWSPISPTRRKSFEDDPVMSLPDPRELASLAYLDIWTGHFQDSLRDAYPGFVNLLSTEFRGSKPADFIRMCHALRKRDQDGKADLELIMREASLLFAGYPDLANSLSNCIPPGYRLEAAEDYVAVYIPGNAWKQYPNGRREPLYTGTPS